MNIEIPSIVKEEKGLNIIDRPKIVAEFMQDILLMEDEVDRAKEHFWIVGVNNQCGVLYIELVSLGILTASLIHPREVFKTAILKNCVQLIAVHNHPSGCLELSEEDKETTRALRAAGEVIKIELLDHVLITEDSYVSIREDYPILFS